LKKVNPFTPVTDLSIIIVNYKSWQPLAQNLDALCQIVQKNLRFEIIVIDNCSNDGQIQVFREKYPTIHFFENSGNWGFAHGCNRGAEKAQSDVLLFLNPDAIASEDALEKMYFYLKNNPEVGIVSCKQSEKAASYQKIFPKLTTLFGLQRSLYKLFHRSKFDAMTCKNNSVVSPDWVSGSVVMMARSWFTKVGSWNEAYWLYFEDVDLSKKVANHGGKIELLCNAFVTHNHGGASRINVTTEALTKAEVIISNHIYIDTHFVGIERFLGQLFLVLNTLIFKGLLAIFVLPFFFIPKLKVQFFIFKNCLLHYFFVLKNNTWRSPRSFLFLEK
jgi:GT2 family glycosyltransferase